MIVSQYVSNEGHLMPSWDATPDTSHQSASLDWSGWGDSMQQLGRRLRHKQFKSQDYHLLAQLYDEMYALRSILQHAQKTPLACYDALSRYAEQSALLWVWPLLQQNFAGGEPFFGVSRQDDSFVVEPVEEFLPMGVMPFLFRCMESAARGQLYAEDFQVLRPHLAFQQALMRAFLPGLDVPSYLSDMYASVYSSAFLGYQWDQRVYSDGDRQLKVHVPYVPEAVIARSQLELHCLETALCSLCNHTMEASRSPHISFQLALHEASDSYAPTKGVKRPASLEISLCYSVPPHRRALLKEERDIPLFARCPHLLSICDLLGRVIKKSTTDILQQGYVGALRQGAVQQIWLHWPVLPLAHGL